MSELLLEPLKYYETVGREKHRENVRQELERRVALSGVDPEQNKKTATAYKAKLGEVQKLEKQLSLKRFFRVLLILVAIVGGFLIIGGIAASPVLIPIGVVLVAVPLLVIFLKLNKTLTYFSETLAQKQAEAQTLLDTAWREMAPLNALLGERDAIDLMQKTLPEIEFDRFYSAERERELRELCAYAPEPDDERSILDILSGEYKGNPFLFERQLRHRMGEETYHGHLTISWTETYRDSKGNLRTRLRTQTLHASVVKPKPFYHQNTVLKYFPQGAPDLSFSREGLYHDDKSEKQIERLVKKGEKKLKKKAEEALEQGKSFTEMNNTEFEVLFDALNRDNEVQFRMMFTPLAQNNMVDLMRSEVGYGDDFDFYKSKRMTTIHSDHAQKWRMDASSAHCRSYDLEEIQRNFQAFHEEYFKSVFFDFAPLLAVPMYQDKPARSLEPLREYKVNYTAGEYETLVNRMDLSHLVAKGSKTRAILKATGLSHTEEADTVEIRALSYRTVMHTDYVPRVGGDGRTHLVPVPWTEYIPIERTSYIEVSPRSEDAGECAVAYHGLSAKFLEENIKEKE